MSNIADFSQFLRTLYFTLIKNFSLMSSTESFCPSHMPFTSYLVLFMCLNARLVRLGQSFQKYIWIL